jgi:hypothetical protein
MAVCTALFASVSFGYDVSTHAAMTIKAVEQSKITADPKTSPLIGRLGIGFKDEPFGEKYLDIGTSVTSRTRVLSLENVVYDALREPAAGLSVPSQKSLTGWLMRGSIREDDNSTETPDTDEPGGVFERVFGHFFDPVNNRGLTNTFVNDPALAPDWALTNNVTANYRLNRYNIPNTREAMWRALTLKRISSGGTLEDIQPQAGTDAKAKEDERKAYWATTFRSLGDVVHLLQDMAQPQHTRNDAHSGLGCTFAGNCLGGHASFYESYIKARTLGANVFRLDEGFLPASVPGGAPLTPGPLKTFTLKPLKYDGYETPKFAAYADFFRGNGSDSNYAAKGLANYSNRGFYSFGTNLGNNAGASYPNPPRAASALTSVKLTGDALVNMVGERISGELISYQGTVRDTLNPAADTPNVRLSSHGIWDEFLEERNFFLRPSLNIGNYDDQAKLLIPRAVAYSAGLIDYFFRGELKIALPDEGVYGFIDHADPASNCKDTCGFKKIKLKLTNTTPDITVSGGGETKVQNMAAGRVVAVVKYSRNDCYSPDLSGEAGTTAFPNTPDGIKQCLYKNLTEPIEEIVVSKPQTGTFSLAKNEEKPLTFEFDDAIPVNAWNVSLQVVYRGPLGDEADAVVVGTNGISAPTFVNLSNESDYLVINQKLRTRVAVNADQTLLSQIANQACVTGTVSNRELVAGCYNSYTADLVWRSPTPLNGARPEIAATVGVTASSFSRVAILGDRTEFTSAWVTSNLGGVGQVLLPANATALNPIGPPTVTESPIANCRQQHCFISTYLAHQVTVDPIQPDSPEYSNRPNWQNPQPKRLTRLAF